MKLFCHIIEKSSIILLLAFAHSFSVWSQEPNFKNYNTSNGLPSHQVYDMYQDNNGVMWFATDRGVSKFNGYTFQNYGLNDGLTSTTIFKFYPQENGDIWCSTINNNFFFFNPRDEIFHPYRYNKTLENLSQGATSADFCIDSKGNKHFSFISWNGVISIDNSGKVINKINQTRGVDHSELVLARLDDNQTIYYLDTVGGPPIFEDEIRTKVVTSVSYHKEGHGDAVNLFSSRQEVILLINGKFKTAINNGRQPIGLGMVDASHFWVGYLQGGGVTIYDLSGTKTESYLAGKEVTDYYQDHEGGLWISTLFSGVFYTADIDVTSYFTEADKSITSITSNKNNELIVNFIDGNVYKKGKDEFTTYYFTKNKREALHQYYSSIDATVIFKDNEVSLSPFQNLQYAKKLAFYRKLSDDSENTPLLASTQYIGIFNNDKIRTFRVKGRVNDVCQLGSLFYFSTNNGLFKYDTVNKVQQKVENPYFDDPVRDIDKFGNGLLIATMGHGLIWSKKGAIRQIGEKEGLTSNLLSEIYVQNDSIIWVCTNAGLNRILFNDDESYSISVITRKNGLIDNDVTDVEVIGNAVWVISRKGLISFPISKLERPRRIEQYYLRLIQAKVNGVPNFDFSNLSYTENRLEFNFQAVSFIENEKLEYRYRLNGLEDTWNYTKNLNVVYEAIQPGSYSFVLQVGVDDVWSDETINVALTIHPPYYKTGWFMALAAVVSVFLIYLFFRFRILSYNRDIIRELLRQLLKRIRRKSLEFTVRSQGRDIKLNSDKVLYVKSLGNYLEIYTSDNKVVIRERISNFAKLVPDSREYMQVHRSYIVRIDQVTEIGVDILKIQSAEISIGNTYKDAVTQIQI